MERRKHGKWREADAPKDLLSRSEMETGLLNSDIISQVLSRLPVKSLLRFKYVSKAWNAIVSDISFRKRHCQRFKAIPSGYISTDDYNLIKYAFIRGNQITMPPLNLDFLPQDVQVVASNNGLLCCRTHRWDSDRSIYVCNPLTKEYDKIVSPDLENIRDYIDVGIICGSVLSSTSFKLVTVSTGVISPNVIRIYFSDTGEWRTIQDACYHDVYVSRAIVASGILYWMTNGNVILAHDVEKEASQLIYLPDRGVWCHNDTPTCGCCFGESGGRLHYICVTNSILQAWVLDGDSKWVLKHSISPAVIAEENPCFLYTETKNVAPLLPVITPTWIEPLAFTDGLLLLKLCTTFHGENMIKPFERIYSYHFETRRAEELCTQHVNFPLNKFLRALPYSMSLIPVGCA